MGMNANPYPTDLTDAEWDLIKNLLPPPKPGGRPAPLRSARWGLQKAAPALGRWHLSWAIGQVGRPAYAVYPACDTSSRRLERLCTAPTAVGGRTYAGVAQSVTPLEQRL